MSYKKLHIWELSMQATLAIHKMTLQLPGFERFETGSQIRRSSKSVKSNIVEGYGRKKYQKEYLRFLVYAQASNDETIDHLETLFVTGSLQNEKVYEEIKSTLVLLGRKLNAFIKTLEKSIGQ